VETRLADAAPNAMRDYQRRRATGAGRVEAMRAAGSAWDAEVTAPARQPADPPGEDPRRHRRPVPRPEPLTPPVIPLDGVDVPVGPDPLADAVVDAAVVLVRHVLGGVVVADLAA
jgi:hypothetical protein